MTEEIAPYSVKLLRFRSGERFPSVVDGRGLLTTQPNIYAVTSLRNRENAAGTGEKRLRAITVALNWAALRGIDLQARTESFELLSPFEVEDLRDALRTNLRAAKGQKGKATVRSDHFVNRCHAVRDYLVWQAEAALQRIRVGDTRLKEARLALDVWIRQHRNVPERYPGAKRVPYVFVSRTGKPLSLRSVNDMYDLLREKVDGLPSGLTTHANRHDANAEFSKKAKVLGWTDAETELARNNHFGWVKGSKQGVHYNKQHAREMSEAYVDTLQRKSQGEPSS